MSCILNSCIQNFEFDGGSCFSSDTIVAIWGTWSLDIGSTREPKGTLPEYAYFSTAQKLMIIQLEVFELLGGYDHF